MEVTRRENAADEMVVIAVVSNRKAGFFPGKYLK